MNPNVAVYLPILLQEREGEERGAEPQAKQGEEQGVGQGGGGGQPAETIPGQDHRAGGQEHHTQGGQGETNHSHGRYNGTQCCGSGMIYFVS